MDEKHHRYLTSKGFVCEDNGYTSYNGRHYKRHDVGVWSINHHWFACLCSPGSGRIIASCDYRDSPEIALKGLKETLSRMVGDH